MITLPYQCGGTTHIIIILEDASLGTMSHGDSEMVLVQLGATPPACFELKHEWDDFVKASVLHNKQRPIQCTILSGIMNVKLYKKEEGVLSDDLLCKFVSTLLWRVAQDTMGGNHHDIIALLGEIKDIVSMGLLSQDSLDKLGEVWARWDEVVERYEKKLEDSKNYLSNSELNVLSYLGSAQNLFLAIHENFRIHRPSEFRRLMSQAVWGANNMLETFMRSNKEMNNQEALEFSCEHALGVLSDVVHDSGLVDSW